MLLIAASILFMSFILFYVSQVYSNGKFEKYIVKDMDENPNMIILVENQSAKKGKITFKFNFNHSSHNKYLSRNILIEVESLLIKLFNGVEIVYSIDIYSL